MINYTQNLVIFLYQKQSNVTGAAQSEISWCRGS